jgi:hypothetical protein
MSSGLLAAIALSIACIIYCDGQVDLLFRRRRTKACFKAEVHGSF